MFTKLLPPPMTVFPSPIMLLLFPPPMPGRMPGRVAGRIAHARSIVTGPYITGQRSGVVANTWPIVAGTYITGQSRGAVANPRPIATRLQISRKGCRPFATCNIARTRPVGVSTADAANAWPVTGGERRWRGGSGNAGPR